MARPTTKKELKAARQHLVESNRKYPNHLVLVPESEWTEEAKANKSHPLATWRSKQFFAQLWVDTGQLRFTVCRSAIKSDGHWQDGITWDDLQRLKSEAGFSNRWAVEIYPPDSEIVNVANMRHLWLLNYPPAFCWRKTSEHTP